VGSALYRAFLGSFRVVAQVHQRSLRTRIRRGDRVVRCDLRTAGAASSLVESAEPELIVHLAALSSLSACAKDPVLATAVNTDLSRELAAAAHSTGAYLLFASTDQVFDGDGAPYGERDRTSPISVYGRTKAEAEDAVLEACLEALVMRFSLVLSPAADGESGALEMLAAAHQRRAELRLFIDEHRTPISILDLGRQIEHALRTRASGVFHAGGMERVDRMQLGRRIAEVFGWHDAVLVGASRKDSQPARPADLSLVSGRLVPEGWPRPKPLDEALREMKSEPLLLGSG